MSSGTQDRWRFPLCPEVRAADGGHHVSIVSIFHILLQHLPHKENTLDWYGRDFSLWTSVAGFVSSGFVVYRLNRTRSLEKQAGW
jgi:hypothetical protein